jgi:hypothetical protein
MPTTTPPAARWRQGDPAAEPPGSLWVTSWMDESRYVCRVSLGGSRLSWTLGRQRGLAYAQALLRVTGIAEHDAAVLRQLIALGVEPEQAAELLAADLRAARPAYDDAATTPLTFRPLVAALGMRPVVTIGWPPQPELDHHAAQMDAADGALHALAVLETLAGVDLDTAYYQMAVAKLGVSELRARALLDDLGRFRQRPPDG